jgi:hypothetical protein
MMGIKLLESTGFEAEICDVQLLTFINSKIVANKSWVFTMAVVERLGFTTVGP